MRKLGGHLLSATHYNTLQRTATRCNTLQHALYTTRVTLNEDSRRALRSISNQSSELCQVAQYGVATISRLFEITDLCCKRALLKRLYSAKETYNFKEPTDRSHPIPRTKARALSHLSVSCGHVLQCVAVCCSVLQCVALCCIVLQCVAVCCSVL